MSLEQAYECWYDVAENPNIGHLIENFWRLDQSNKMILKEQGECHVK